MPRSARPTRTAVVLSALAISSGAVGSPQDEHDSIVEKSQFFESQAWPIIERECLPCHGGAERVRGGFRIDARAGLLQGGDRGPAIDGVDPAESLLLEMISWKSDDYQMPPSGRLDDDEISILTEWVLEGSTWADGIGTDLPADAFEARTIPDGGDWWAWQPLVQPAIPTVADSS